MMEVSQQEFLTLMAGKIASESIVAARKDDKADVKAERDAAATERKEALGAIVKMANTAMSSNHRMGMALTPSSAEGRPHNRPPSSQGSEFYEDDDPPALLRGPTAAPAPPAPAPAGAIILGGAPAAPALVGGGESLVSKVARIKECLGITEQQTKAALLEAAAQMGIAVDGRPLPALANALLAELFD